MFGHVFVFAEVGISLAGCTQMSNGLQWLCICIFVCIWTCICICRSGYFFGRLHTDEQWLARRVGQYAFGKRSSYPLFVFSFFVINIFPFVIFMINILPFVIFMINILPLVIFLCISSSEQNANSVVDLKPQTLRTATPYICHNREAIFVANLRTFKCQISKP